MTEPINSAAILPTADLEQLRSALRDARDFIAEELLVRENSFDSDEPEHSLYIKPAKALIEKIESALARTGGGSPA